jgi:hypothetical protein
MNRKFGNLTFPNEEEKLMFYSSAYNDYFPNLYDRLICGL